jgi:hypothetical protein
MACGAVDTDQKLALIPLRRLSGDVAAYALVDEQDAWLAGRTWHLSPDGYAVGRQQRRTMYMHRLITGATEHQVVDHINRNRLDNRRCNLRITDWTGNSRNRAPGRTSYRGIRQNGSFFRVRIRHEGISHLLKGFETAEDAALAYDMAAIALFGVETPTNFDYGEGLRGLDAAGRDLLSKYAPDWLGEVDPAARTRQILDEATAHAAEVLRVD